jgi:hypothetical protein
MDSLILDARTLLIAARSVGMSVDVADDRLLVRGPKGAAGLARLLVERKPNILAALETERAAIEPSAAAIPEGDARSPRPWPPRPTELAGWPIPWRERWGRLANDLQDQGIPWPDHEREAFDQVKAHPPQRLP